MEQTAEIDIQLCAFSRHAQPFHHVFRSGLDTYILRLQMEGESEALIDGRMEQVLPGDLMLFSPGQAYDLWIGNKESKLGPSGDYYVMCTGSWLDDWWSRRERPAKTRIADVVPLVAVWEPLIVEKRRLDGGSQEILASLLKALCNLIDRAIEEAPIVSTASVLSALKMKGYIEAHANEPLKLEDIARQAGISVTRAVHLFKARFGVSIMKYVQQVRLAIALRLMENSQFTLERIAEEAGFGSYTYLHRVFRERYGVSPGEYRKRK
ncbi:AraC family transcriptional regulator [Cohnella lubricantis]|uniref:Helix-turn-helix transcriptional regulator n=1 Tax=Cohnella lubricantis TaxID=2163172 RepID=A0A841TA01_9BACL|nr:AraC family transcriptional regulator [Cohnella lubricantis]MBB6676090.1 helix-turn-helix transcriptional regulator [Cohnella lubricantis]MBP2118047.1 AraC family transcriptional regulator of arabinose operon [Cohnella lubricantis]